MDDLQSEKEQLEAMRTWWSEYGNYVLSGVAIGALSLFGINYVQNQQVAAETAASLLYDEISESIAAQNLDESSALVEQLATEHSDSPYAIQARFGMARLYMDQNRDEDAADVLRAILADEPDEAFAQVARIRLAKILLYQGKADDVLTLLEGQEEGAFSARIADTLGDTYVVLDRPIDARDAYQRALSEQGNAATVNQQFVQLKLLDLPSDLPPVDLAPAETDSADVEEGE